MNSPDLDEHTHENQTSHALFRCKKGLAITLGLGVLIVKGIQADYSR
jgi:hypothetical protein